MAESAFRKVVEDQAVKLSAFAEESEGHSKRERTKMAKRGKAS